MTLSSERARSLLQASVPAGESLTDVAVALFPGSIALTLLVVFGLPAILIAVLLALKVDARNPAVTAGITAGVLGAMILGVLLLRRRTRYCVVGLTSQRLLVARLAGQTGLRITAVSDYPLADLRGVPVQSKFPNMGAAGAIYTVPRLEIADPKRPLRIDFLPTLMPGNREAYYPIRDAVMAAADPSSKGVA